MSKIKTLQSTCHSDVFRVSPSQFPPHENVYEAINYQAQKVDLLRIFFSKFHHTVLISTRQLNRKKNVALTIFKPLFIPLKNSAALKFSGLNNQQQFHHSFSVPTNWIKILNIEQLVIQLILQLSPCKLWTWKEMVKETYSSII